MSSECRVCTSLLTVSFNTCANYDGHEIELHVHCFENDVKSRYLPKRPGFSY